MELNLAVVRLNAPLPPYGERHAAVLGRGGRARTPREECLSLSFHTTSSEPISGGSLRVLLRRAAQLVRSKVHRSIRFCEGTDTSTRQPCPLLFPPTRKNESSPHTPPRIFMMTSSPKQVSTCTWYATPPLPPAQTHRKIYPMYAPL